MTGYSLAGCAKAGAVPNLFHFHFKREISRRSGFTLSRTSRNQKRSAREGSVSTPVGATLAVARLTTGRPRGSPLRDGEYFSAKAARKAAPVLNLRYILVINCEDLTDRRLKGTRTPCGVTRRWLCRDESRPTKFTIEIELLIRHVRSSVVIPAQAGIQWRARRADIDCCWIPGQVRNDECDIYYVPDQ
jgi:hypothetical protein